MSIFIESLIANCKQADKKIVRIGVHNGTFHADELLALAVVQEALPSDWKIEAERTRDAAKIKECDLVVDVGGGRFDHHDNEKKLLPNGIPHCGATLILEVVEEDPALRNLLLDQLFYAVAAQDNGFELPAGICPSKLSFVSTMNPTWLETKELRAKMVEAKKQFNVDDVMNFAFSQAFGFVHVIYKRVRSAAKATLEAKAACDKAPLIDHPKGKVLELDAQIPWLNWAYGHPEVIAAVYPDDNGGWDVRVAQTTPGKFDTRCTFPASWGGKEGAELEEVSTIKGATFCHRGLWFAKFADRDAALEAVAWLEV